MTVMTDTKKVEADLLAEIKDTFKKARIILADECENLETGKSILERLRKSAYERMNQIQHEALLVSGIKYLKSRNLTSNVTICWNPRQTGTKDEPDLRICRDSEVLVSAEATTSYAPKGYIDRRMAETLKKLSGFAGQKFYFVVSEEMQKRARSKI